jgi:hypothetical protein
VNTGLTSTKATTILRADPNPPTIKASIHCRRTSLFHETPLHIAARIEATSALPSTVALSTGMSREEHAAPMVRALLRAGADTEAKDQNGRTPLESVMAATSAGPSRDLVVQLLKM